RLADIASPDSRRDSRGVLYRNSGNGRDQRNRGQQSNRSVHSGFQQSRGPSEGYSYLVCTTCGRRHLREFRRAAGTCFKCSQTGHLQKDCKKNTAASTSGQADKKPGASGRVFAIVADALSRKLGMIAGIKVEEEIICNLERLDIELYVHGQHGYWASLRTEFRLDKDDVLWQGTRLCVPNDAILREAMLTEAHSSSFSVHPGSTKIPHFIGPFEILDLVGEVSYRLPLPPQLSHVHNVFYVSLLRGYKYHPLHVISYPLDQIHADLSYVKEPEAILDRQDRVTRNKTIPFKCRQKCNSKYWWKKDPDVIPRCISCSIIENFRKRDCSRLFAQCHESFQTYSIGEVLVSDVEQEQNLICLIGDTANETSQLDLNIHYDDHVQDLNFAYQDMDKESNIHCKDHVEEQNSSFQDMDKESNIHSHDNVEQQNSPNMCKEHVLSEFDAIKATVGIIDKRKGEVSTSCLEKKLDIVKDKIVVKENQRKGQNRIKTRRKREAWRSREKSKAISVKKERKTKKIHVKPV
nr:hypothetical protein [Tanacetum cinerariifolium]